MTEEYLEKLESILLFLQTRENTTNEELEPLASPYWLNIKQYLLEKKALISPNGGGVFWVRQKFISKSLEDIRIQKGRITEKKVNKREDDRRNFRRDLICTAIGTVIGSIATIIIQAGWDRLSCILHEDPDKHGDTRPDQSSKNTKEKTTDDSDGLFDTTQLR